MVLGRHLGGNALGDSAVLRTGALIKYAKQDVYWHRIISNNSYINNFIFSCMD